MVKKKILITIYLLACASIGLFFVDIINIKPVPPEYNIKSMPLGLPNMLNITMDYNVNQIISKVLDGFFTAVGGGLGIPIVYYIKKLWKKRNNDEIS